MQQIILKLYLLNKHSLILSMLFTSFFYELIINIIIIDDKMFTRIVSSQKTLVFYCLRKFSARSYYDILDVPTNASDKDIKIKFLEKARKYHPDHNPSPQANQQFKVIKEAYETLKDSQKRYQYDTGLSVDPTEHTDIHINRQRAGQKYYHNKWYGFQKKGTHQDLRDQFYSSRQQRYQDYQSDNGELNRVALRKISGRIFGIVILSIGIFGWQFIKSRKLEQDVISEHKKNVLQQSVNKSQNKVMKKYIQIRERAHKVID